MQVLRFVCLELYDMIDRLGQRGIDGRAVGL